MSQNERTLKHILLELVTSGPIKDPYLQMGLKEAWTREMGPNIAQYTSDLIFKGGVLTVYIRSAPLRQELMLGREKIKQIINQAVPGAQVREVKIR